MNFCDYKTPEELKEKTGLTVKEALEIVNREIEKIKEGDRV